MRVAFFSPMPPARSGIADYSATLVEHLRRYVDVEVFDSPRAFDAAAFDIALYQLGNNDWHGFVYEQALRTPGVAVMHEPNLHHLIASLTIKRDDWDGYLAEAERDGGAEARAHAERVRRLEVGPDYEGVTMTRRVLEHSRACIAHSDFVLDKLRGAGFAGPAARIPHGAWVVDADRNGYRDRLGIDETSPLIGTFGFLKPYKRIAESLRAFSRVVRNEPRARMILVGEEHPDFNVRELVRALGLSAHVRIEGFAAPEDFTGFISACDIVLNLRYPTLGESSGSLLRALGLGRATLVSDVGAFREFPDGVVAKVPVGAGEEDAIFEYLALLTSRQDIRDGMGARAREWVTRECGWDQVARRYAAFLEAVAAGGEYVDAPGAVPLPEPPREPLAEYVAGWAPDEEARGYIQTHISRFAQTLAITPPGTAADRVLEMGAYLQITPALQTRLGYGEVRGCYFGPAGRVERRTVRSDSGEEFTCDVDLFDAEKDAYPYPDEHFTTVLCCELIEHLFNDPMHLMSEVNRIIKPGGWFVLTTPNIASTRAVAAILQGYHPGFYPSYIRPQAGGETDARHNREYAPREIRSLCENSGFAVERLETGEFRDAPHPEFAWVERLFTRYQLPTDLRGDGIYVVGRKTGAVRERYPAWLYS